MFQEQRHGAKFNYSGVGGGANGRWAQMQICVVLAELVFCSACKFSFWESRVFDATYNFNENTSLAVLLSLLWREEDWGGRKRCSWVCIEVFEVFLGNLKNFAANACCDFKFCKIINNFT